LDRETVLVGIDAGTTKVTTLIGEVDRGGDVNIIGYGIAPSVGMKKGMVANIDQTVNSIAASLEKAERLSGYKISSAFVAVGGSHISSQNSRGVVAVSGHKREVSREDVARATEAAKAIQVPSNREILHVIPRGYIVDGQEGIKDPLGMSAVRLEVETHIVAGAATSIQNLSKCIANANVQIDEMVISSLAAAEATLTDTEKELGVMVADIGGGTTDLAIFTDGAVYHSAVLPVGAINVTNDVAIGLRTSLDLAEEIKIKHGSANLAEIAPEELLNVAVLGEGGGQTIQRKKLCEIIEARMSEIYSLIGEEIKRSGHAGLLPAGVVLTGGGARLGGVAELAREVLQMPVRVASPQGVGGLMDQLSNPAFSTPIGLLLWGAHHIGSEPITFSTSSPMGTGLGRVMDWIRGLFPG
jgi:cell division protein FtsA